MAVCMLIGMTPDGTHFPDRVLLSYDVSGTARSAAVQVCQIVFGRTRVARLTGEVRHETGFIHRAGVVWIGQSVLVLPPADADELAARLRRLEVRVAMAPVAIGRASLEAFRRPA